MIRRSLLAAALAVGVSAGTVHAQETADGGAPPADEPMPAAQPAPAPPPALAPANPPPAPQPTPTPTEKPTGALGTRGSSPLENAAGVEALPGFHWVTDDECPPGETKREERVTKKGKKQLGCVAPTRGFVKGELTTLGSTKLILKDSRFGVAVGTEVIYDGNSFVKNLLSGVYLHIQPEVELRFQRWAIGLNVPLNFLIWPGGWSEGSTVLRKQDWATPASWARVITYITYGNKEDRFYLNISQLYAATIGHGNILKRYFANINFNETHVGAEIDAYNRYVGLQAFTRDILPVTLSYPAQSNGNVAPDASSSAAFLPPVLAVLGFVRPFGWSDNLYAKYISLGLTYAADFGAPYALARNSDGNFVVQPNGTLRIGDTRMAHLIGVDLEMKAYKSAHADVKPYIDGSGIVGGGGALTAGALGRFSLGRNNRHAIRAGLYARWLNGQYLPSYFDTMYEVQKYQFLTSLHPTETQPPPKLAYVLGGDQGAWFMQLGGEISYSFEGGFALTLAYEDGFSILDGNPNGLACPRCFSSRDSAVLRNISLHLEYPVLSWFQFFATISRRAYLWERFFAFDDTLFFYVQGRVHLAPILFLNLGAFRTWAINPQSGIFENVYGFNLSLELGYEFDMRRKWWKRKKD